jgi:hypothetical protein
LGVWRKLKESVKGLEAGAEFEKGLRSGLANLAKEITTKGTEMNDMVTKQGNWQSKYSKGNKGESSNSMKGGGGYSINKEIRNDNRRKN